jgi:hypothetical protein
MYGLFAEFVPVYRFSRDHMGHCTSRARYREALLCHSVLCRSRACQLGLHGYGR